jgi:hypothetical protein
MSHGRRSVSVEGFLARAGTAATRGPWIVGPRFFATIQKSKRPRRRKSLVSTSTGTTTTKDRMRTLIDKNLVQVSLLPTRSHATDMLSLAGSRVGWVRDKVYEFWNADAVGGQTSAASGQKMVPEAVVEIRPVKVDMNMNGRWWLWNILFALIPATAIGVYCEFRGQYLMHDYYEGLEMDSVKRIMGDDFLGEHEEELSIPPPQNFVVRIVQFCQEVTNMVMGSTSTNHDDAADRDAEGQEQHQQRLDGMEQSVFKQPIAGTPSTAADVGRVVEPVKDAAADTVAPRPDGAPALSPAVAAAVKDNAHSEKSDLVLRIEHLEELLFKQEQNRQRQVKYQLERLQQSGTRNRMEDNLIQKWKHQTTTAGTGTTTPVSGDDPNVDVQQQQPAMGVAPTNHELRQQQQPQQHPTSGSSDDKGSNETSAWSSLWNVKKVAEDTLRQTADRVMPLLGEAAKGGGGNHDKQEPIIKESATTETLEVQMNESTIRGLGRTHSGKKSVSGHDMVRDSADTEGVADATNTTTANDEKDKNWWKPW